MSWPHSINAVLTTLQTDHVIEQSDLNAQAQALPVENGVIDPSSGVGHDYDDILVHPLHPRWLFTKGTRLRHEVAALSLPRARFWARSLDRWFPNPEVKEFAQRIMGYAVFGRGQEKVFVIAHGQRDSGKSAFFNNLAYLLRDFAVQISPEALIASKYENEAQYGLAHIAGARLYVSSELKAGTRLNSALIKRLSSGGSDTVRARAMRQDFIDIIPQGLLAIMTNYVPQDDQLDEALWGRTIILPFEGRFPANDPETVKDAQLQQLLIAEREGILQWLVEGYANYVALGLRRPRAIDTIIASVKQEQDWATPFIGEWLEEGSPEDKVLCRDARLAYEVWCHDTGDEPILLYRWRETMRDRLAIPKRGTAGRHYYFGWKMKRQLDTLPEGWTP
jgi:putative DNA primase/helicase